MFHARGVCIKMLGLNFEHKTCDQFSLYSSISLYGCGLCDILKVLDAVDLLQRYKTALPLVLRQIEVHCVCSCVLLHVCLFFWRLCSY